MYKRRGYIQYKVARRMSESFTYLSNSSRLRDNTTLQMSLYSFFACMKVYQYIIYMQILILSVGCVILKPNWKPYKLKVVNVSAIYGIRSYKLKALTNTICKETFNEGCMEIESGVCIMMFSMKSKKDLEELCITEHLEWTSGLSFPLNGFIPFNTNHLIVFHLILLCVVLYLTKFTLIF